MSYSLNNRFVTVRCVTLVPTKAIISVSDTLRCSTAMQRIQLSFLSVGIRTWLDPGFLKIVPTRDFLKIMPTRDFLKIMPTGDFLKIMPIRDFLKIVPTIMLSDYIPSKSFCNIKEIKSIRSWSYYTTSFKLSDKLMTTFPSSCRHS
ncbi:UNVERIFIED_CONTAM: hypothetical protein NCL1_17431 [Trichonephila clavipes]